MKHNWVPIIGNFEFSEQQIVFKGSVTKDNITGKEFPMIGNCICDKKFGGGDIEATIKFKKLSKNVTACGLMFCYDSDQRYFVTTSIDIRPDIDTAFRLQHFDQKWTFHDVVGQKTFIKGGKDYKVRVHVEGSSIEFFVNEVSVIKKNLPFPLPRKQVGIWCQSSEDIIIKNYVINELDSKAFVIMQFTPPYNELFEDVIAPTCSEKSIKAIRADEKYGPGHILTDIMSEIYSAKFIIAEITPENQNVFFEVGYAHAVKKPIILIAEKGKELPFDVSGFRVLFYENSIRGKKEVQENLSRNIDAIFSTPFS